VAPHEWWHVSPRFAPLGPLKTEKVPTTCPSILPCHADVRCKCSFIGTKNMLPCVFIRANHMIPHVACWNQLDVAMCLARGERKGLVHLWFHDEILCKPLPVFLDSFKRNWNFYDIITFKRFTLKKLGFSDLQPSDVPMLRRVISSNLWCCNRRYVISNISYLWYAMHRYVMFL